MNAAMLFISAVTLLAVVGAVVLTCRAIRNFQAPKFVPTEGEQGFVHDPGQPAFEEGGQ